MEDVCHSATFIMSLTRIWLVIVVQSPELADVPYSHYLQGSLISSNPWSSVVWPIVCVPLIRFFLAFISRHSLPLTGGINPLPHAF
jgi:hypothetical protein